MMTSTRRRSLLGLLAAAPLAGVLTGATAAHAGSDRPPGDLLPGGAFDRYVAQRAAAGLFSGTVLLAHRGRPVLSRAYGTAIEQRSVPNRPDTLVNLASVTKCVTAVAVAQLVQRGALSFTGTLGTYLDGFPAAVADTVTVHQLLTHTSGMGDYSSSPDFPAGIAAWDSAGAVMDGILAIIRKAPLGFTPGTRFGYSNSGFVVLGAIVARVSGLSYFDYVRRHVFAPAGMTRSDFCTRPQVLARDDIAHPYAADRSGGSGGLTDVTASPYFGFIGGPANGAYSTGAELLRFAAALRDGTLLAPALANLVTTGKVALTAAEAPPPAGDGIFYGYGHLDDVAAPQRIFGHSGRGPGQATNLDVHPGPGWVAVVLSNHDTAIDPIVALERQLIRGASR